MHFLYRVCWRKGVCRERPCQGRRRARAGLAEVTLVCRIMFAQFAIRAQYFCRHLGVRCARARAHCQLYFQNKRRCQARARMRVPGQTVRGH
ncbi:hypothetical protein MAR_024811 [Mya arenaria]|uniref:Uncharacterized protein n=1 Tax=Mya arenaria TaxID=6604 RepID=A0ABY7DWH0_MYAAR|nr:hypothetical protein MAR_024811 [Mya arenaria]